MAPTIKSAQQHTNYPRSLAKNILKLMEKKGISECILARSLGLPYNTIKRITAGETTDPKISTLTLIADYFGVGVDALMDSKSQLRKSPQKHHPISVPVFSWDDISTPNFSTDIAMSNWANWQPIALAESQKLSLDAYALKSRKSMGPRFPTGTLFIIDPDETPTDGDIVLVKILETGEVSLRELEIDPPIWSLCSVNSSLPPLQLEKTKHKIIGVSVLTIFHSRN